jgi:hypothetical protein
MGPSTRTVAPPVTRREATADRGHWSASDERSPEGKRELATPVDRRDGLALDAGTVDRPAQPAAEDEDQDDERA